MTEELHAIPDNIDQDLVFGFFWKFAAFECKLKSGVYLKVENHSKVKFAEPDWRKFAMKIKGHFHEVSQHDFLEAVKKLKEFSPRRQIVKGSELGWEEILQKKNQSEEEYVIELLKAARNNLFHGGKYQDGPIAEIARDEAILKVALCILDACYELHEKLEC